MNQIAVIGLGYVGLPVALAIAKKFPNTIGFDINQEKIAALNQGIDFTGEVASDVHRKVVGSGGAVVIATVAFAVLKSICIMKQIKIDYI